MRRMIPFVIAATLLVVGHSRADEPNVKQLSRILSSGKVEARIEAANELGKLGAKAAPAVPAINSALMEKDTNLRVACAQTLGAIGPDAKEGVELWRWWRRKHCNV